MYGDVKRQWRFQVVDAFGCVLFWFDFVCRISKNPNASSASLVLNIQN